MSLISIFLHQSDVLLQLFLKIDNIVSEKGLLLLGGRLLLS
jgi:hypothetical protein